MDTSSATQQVQDMNTVTATQQVQDMDEVSVTHGRSFQLVFVLIATSLEWAKRRCERTSNDTHV
jgi:hypothetical protein